MGLFSAIGSFFGRISGSSNSSNNPDIKNLFICKVTSERVEKFLSDNNSTVRFIPIKTN